MAGCPAATGANPEEFQDEQCTYRADATGGQTPYSLQWTWSGLDSATGSQGRFLTAFVDGTSFSVAVTVTDAAGDTASASKSVSVASSGIVHRAASTTPAHTAAPTATCAACRAGGSPSSTVAAPTLTCTPINASTSFGPRAGVRSAHTVANTVNE